MKIDIGTTINLPPEEVWDAVRRPELLRHIAWPLIRFSPTRGALWPLSLKDGEAVPVRLWLLGVIPFGLQWIVPSVHQSSGAEWPRRLRDNGHSRLIRRWDHWITVQPDGRGGTVYRDIISVDAGVLTLFVSLFAHLFYRHRQRRWRGLADRLRPYRLIWDRRASYLAARARLDDSAAWVALQARHILAQPYFAPHVASHMVMLRFALAQRDWRESGGQILRLALVPLGNATGRLPVGNHGRARVSPFLPMPIPQDISDDLASHEPMLSKVTPRDSA